MGHKFPAFPFSEKAGGMVSWESVFFQAEVRIGKNLPTGNAYWSVYIKSEFCDIVQIIDVTDEEGQIEEEPCPGLHRE